MKLSATHAFNCKVLVVKFGWSSYKDIPPALFILVMHLKIYNNFSDAHSGESVTFI